MPGDNLRQRVNRLPWATPSQDVGGDVATGDLWQATWAHSRLLVLILVVAENNITVSPVTETDTGDERTVVLPGDESPLDGVAFHVWLGLRAVVPQRVLDRRLGPVSPDFRRRLGDTSPRAFPPITSPLDNRSQLRDDVEDRLEALSQAEWQPATTDRSIRQLVGVPPGQFAKAIDILPGDAVNVFARRRRLTPSEADRAATTFNLDLADVVAATTPLVPDEVISIFDHPRRSRLVHRRARETGVTEPEVMLQITAPLLEMAARTTGHTPPDWASLIDDALSD
jgi:hypothetical protein